MKKNLLLFLILIIFAPTVFSGCMPANFGPGGLSQTGGKETRKETTGLIIKQPEKGRSYVVFADGMTIRERFPVPEGFSRVKADGYGEFLRNRKLLPDQSPVLLYDGTQKPNQSAHAAVLAIDTGDDDRQQCADAALRLRSEYLYEQKAYDKISFHLTNGFAFPYEKYAKGYRLKVSGNQTSLQKSGEEDYSYERFRKYLDVLFAYAGSLSVEAESTPVKKDDMKIGDIFIKGGSPGHCVIVADLCENGKTGERAFLLMQSFMPAQQIHILKNPSSQSPWYLLNELSYPFETPQFTFEHECLRRMP